MMRELGILVSAKGASAAARDIGKVDAKVKGLNSGLGRFASQIRGGAGRAMGTFSGRIKGIASASVGLLGIGGLLTFGKVFSDSITKARDFGDATVRMAALTGLAASEASKLVDTLDFFGIAGDKAEKIAGMAAKNVDRLGGTAKKAKDFQQQYGLRITDSTGRLLDFNEQLLASADFFNDKSIPASRKAAALAKLYGKSWQDLLPVLMKGRAGIEEAQKKAMTLSEADLDALAKNKQATREWDDAIGDLQTRIGIDLLPTITDLVSTLTGFVESNGPQIRDFFKNALSTGKNLGGAAFDAIKGIADVWNGIPEPIRDMLVKGFVADRTIKFLFGFSIADVAGGLAGGVAKGLGAALVQQGIGKAFVQPVFVTNQGFGAGGGAGAAGRGLGLVGGALATGGVATAVVAGGIDLATIAGGVGAAYNAYEKGDMQGLLDAQRNTVAELLLLNPALKSIAGGIFDMGQDAVDAANDAKSRQQETGERIRGGFNMQKAEIARTASRTQTAVERAKGAIDWSRMTTAVKGDAIVNAIRGINWRVNVTIPMTLNASQRRAVARAQTGGTMNRGPSQGNTPGQQEY